MKKQPPAGSGGGPPKRKRKATRTPHDTAISPGVTASIKVSHERERGARDAAAIAETKAKGVAKARNELRTAEATIGEIIGLCQGRFPDAVPAAETGRVARPLACVLRWALVLQERIDKSCRLPGAVLNLLQVHLPLAPDAVLRDADEFVPDIETGELMPMVSDMLGVTAEEVDRLSFKHLRPTDLTAEEMEARRRASKSAQRKTQRAARSPDQVEADRIERRNEDAARKAGACADMEARRRAGNGFIATAVGVSTEAVRKWKTLGRDRLLLNMTKRIGLDEAERVLLEHEVAEKLQEERVALGKSRRAKLQEERVALGEPAAGPHPELQEERVALIEEYTATRSSSNLAGDEPGRAECPSPASTAIAAVASPTTETSMPTSPIPEADIPSPVAIDAAIGGARKVVAIARAALPEGSPNAVVDEIMAEAMAHVIAGSAKRAAEAVAEAVRNDRQSRIDASDAILEAAPRHPHYAVDPTGVNALARVVRTADELWTLLEVTGEVTITKGMVLVADTLLGSGRSAREVGAAMLAAAGQPSALQ